MIRNLLRKMEENYSNKSRNIFIFSNGTGNYYIEARTRDNKRTDIIIDYRGKQFIIELKIWHGDEYNKRGEKQLFEYLEIYKQERGYLLSFNFNKQKKTGIHEVRYKEKKILEVVV